MRILLLLLGVAAGQAILYGPSLAGQKLLLPLDILAGRGIYLPDTPEYRGLHAHNPVLSDAIFSLEMERRFATSELRAGRLPLWTPHQFAGSPAAVWGKYSPFNLPYYAFPTPRTLAWIELAKALVATGGAFLFFRRTLGASFWPAAFGAWAYPLTGYFTLWQLFPATAVIAWLPWVLLATDRALRRPGGLGGPALALTSALAWLSGQIDVAALVLLASALYAFGCLFETHGWRLFAKTSGAGIAALLAGWLLGTALAAPYLLPLLEYSATGARMQERAAGAEDRPPVGLVALPEVVFPEIYGSLERSGVRTLPGNRMRGAAAAYAGLLTALVLAPLAFANRPQRSRNVLWLALGAFALAWILGVPGIVELLRLPPLRMLSFNRFVFLTGFALLALSVVGLEALRREPPPSRRAVAAAAALLAGLALYCATRAVWLPADVTEAIARAEPAVRAAAAGAFLRAYALAALLCALGAGAWLLIGWQRSPLPRRGLAAALGGLALAELLGFGRGLNPQSDPALYYPTLPVLASLAERSPERVLGVACLPARLAESHGLRDVRGYDGVDPARLMDLMSLAAAGGGPEPLPYARTQYYNPRIEIAPPDRVALSPLLDMLGVRHLVFRGEPPAGFAPPLAGGDYWVLENARALPRAFVPEQVEIVSDPAQRLARLAAADFDARRLALLEREVELPPQGRGRASVFEARPGSLTLVAELETPGLVVLAELWDAGWRARLEGEPVPILRANHALQGVLAPAGRSRIELRYWPASLSAGLLLAAAAGIALALWAALRRA